jgi:hypothetical protein
MATIQNNSRHLIEINFIGENSKPQILKLLPGVNLNQSDSLWKYAKNHPCVINWLESGTLSILIRQPQSEGKLEGIPVITAPDDGEPLPILGKQRKPRTPKSDPQSTLSLE